MVAHDNMPSPDQFFLLVLVGMFAAGRAKAFLWDWLPPVLLLLGYDSLRGVVPDLTSRAHISPMIDFDIGLFGQVPTLQLQDRFFTAGQTHWYDTAAVILYFLYFIVPLFVALAFWLSDRPLFKKYMTAMVIVSYLAFITYYVFPAMPPWMASRLGYLPPVTDVMSAVLADFGHPVAVPAVYQFIGVNLVAAVPSCTPRIP